MVNLLSLVKRQILKYIYILDIITNWVWCPTGWLFQMNVMDYAGGITVHLSSGAAAGKQ